MADGTEHSAESAAWGQQQAAGRRGACHGLDDPVGCERPRRQGRDSAGMGLAAVCLAAMMLGGAEGNFLEERHRADRKCSLATVEVEELDPNQYCSFVPSLGVTDQSRVLVRFGESDCEVTLRQCMPGFCYVVRDFSFFLPRDLDVHALARGEPIAARFGIFSNASTVVVEGAEAKVTPEGLYFKPTGGDITLRYSTRTCADFYSEFGREWPQVCTSTMGLLSQPYLVFDKVDGLGCTSGLPR